MSAKAFLGYGEMYFTNSQSVRKTFKFSRSKGVGAARRARPGDNLVSCSRGVYSVENHFCEIDVSGIPHPHFFVGLKVLSLKGCIVTSELNN